MYASPDQPHRRDTGRGGIYYCALHYRLSTMAISARQSYRVSMSVDALESLYESLGKPTHCPRCLRAFTYHQDEGRRATVMSLQHNSDGSLMFLCTGCNSGHRNSKLGDRFLRLNPKTEKYCPRCEQVLPIEAFGADRANVSGLTSRCRRCSVSWQMEVTARKRYHAEVL